MLAECFSFNILRGINKIIFINKIILRNRPSLHSLQGNYSFCHYQSSEFPYYSFNSTIRWSKKGSKITGIVVFLLNIALQIKI
jgi:hypothetical protein